MATLERYLQTGELGSLRCGMSVDEVRAILGAPEDVSVRNRPLILKYGAIQLTFHAESGDAVPKLTHIAIYFSDSLGSIPEVLQPTDWAPTGSTTREEFVDFLNQHNITVEPRTAADGDHLKVASGAQIIFDEGRLHSIQFSFTRSTGAKRQVSVTIPQGAWDRVRDEAQKSRRSVADLCSEWITEKANAND